jgi:hypothetical protein
MLGRNLKATHCGCVIDHAEAPDPCQQPRGRVHNAPVGRVKLKNRWLQARFVVTYPAVNLRFARYPGVSAIDLHEPTYRNEPVDFLEARF